MDGTRISARVNQSIQSLLLLHSIPNCNMDCDEEDMLNSGYEPQAGPSNHTGDSETPLSKKAIKRAAKQVRPS